MLIVSLPLLGVGSNFLEGESQSWILCSFLVTCLGESINMLGVLQEAEDAERRACMRSYFKLNISSIPTLSHLLDCLICTRSSTFIVLFLQGMGWFDRWHVVDLYQVVGSGIESVYYHIVLVFSGMYFIFCSLISSDIEGGYHFNLLICYSCSCYSHAFIPVALLEWKLPPLNEPGKNLKLSRNFVEILTFCLARRFHLLLSLVWQPQL